MASILAGWLRDLDVLYFSVVNTSHWHGTTCLVKSLIHDACMIFVWAEELSRHTVVLHVSYASVAHAWTWYSVCAGWRFFCQRRWCSHSVCVMIGVSTDIFPFFICFYLCTFFTFFYSFRFYLCTMCTIFIIIIIIIMQISMWNWVRKSTVCDPLPFQCSDAVGWVTGRPSGL